MTLMKNEPAGPSAMTAGAPAAPLLPLSRSSKIALIGPQANITLAMLSDYAGHNTLVLNHSTYMAARAAGLDVTYTPGHDLDVSSGDKSHIPAAVSAARCGGRVRSSNLSIRRDRFD
jgi:hypothetical protein